MADYSFAPGALKGLFGAYNFGVDSENTLENMFQRRETHDVDTKTKRLQYDILKQNEDALGPIKRQYEAEKTKSELELLPWEKQKKRAEAGQAVSQADLQNMRVELEQKERRMGAVEQAYDYMQRRAMPGDQMGPPSPLDASDDIILKTLQEGGWSDEEIQRYTGGNPQRLAQWVQQGAMMAEGDRKKLEERRKHLNNIQIAQINHPPSGTLPWRPDSIIYGAQEKYTNFSDAPPNVQNQVRFAISRLRDLSKHQSLLKLQAVLGTLTPEAIEAVVSGDFNEKYADILQWVGGSVKQKESKTEEPKRGKRVDPADQRYIDHAQTILNDPKASATNKKLASDLLKNMEEKYNK